MILPLRLLHTESTSFDRFFFFFNVAQQCDCTSPDVKYSTIKSAVTDIYLKFTASQRCTSVLSNTLIQNLNLIETKLQISTNVNFIKYEID